MRGTKIQVGTGVFSSVVFSGLQWSSVVFSGLQWSSLVWVFIGLYWSSMVYNSTLVFSMVFSGLHWSSVLSPLVLSGIQYGLWYGLHCDIQQYS